MTSKDLIKQYVDSGLLIPEYQFNQLNDKLKKTYLRKRMMASKTLPLVDYEIISLPDDVRTNYINDLSKDGIYILIKDSNEPEKIMNLLGNKGIEVINNLDSKGIDILLMYSKEPKKIINILGNKGIEFINNLDSDGIYGFIFKLKEPEKFMNMLGNKGIEFINNLDSNGIISLFKHSQEPEKIMSMLGNKGIEFINSDRFDRLLSGPNQPLKIKELIRKYRPDVQLR